MSDYQVDYSGVLNAIQRNIAQLSSNIGIINSNIGILDNKLQDLQADFIQMMKEQRMSAALQRAITEVIRVRQEVEQQFGNYKLVRDNMLGILQAADLSLIKETTISRCTEELMLSAPEYWLAPCLIALAAWISNNESLANRAIKEAVRRDREKTCLLFALICRRNGRTDTCFEWLSEYFKLQRPDKMTSSIVAFIDAYTNGVFGEDKDNVCQEHIRHWMQTLKDTNPDFVQEQVDYWKGFFQNFAPSLDSRSPKYKALAAVCNKEDFAKINNVTARLIATEGEGGAKSSIKKTYNAEIDKKKLTEDIDTQLKNLVTNYETKEATLRDEETYLNYIKEFKGDEVKAQKIMAYIKDKRRDDPVDFATRLRTAVLDSNSALSAKKTAVILLKDYITEAYGEYLGESKDTYPEDIRLNINAEVNSEGMKGASRISWSGKTTTGENFNELKKTLEEKYDNEKEAAIAKIKTPGILYVLFVIPGLLAESKNKKRRAAAAAKFDAQKAEKVKLLEDALLGRQEADKMVSDFYANSEWKNIELKEEAK